MFFLVLYTICLFCGQHLTKPPGPSPTMISAAACLLLPAGFTRQILQRPARRPGVLRPHDHQVPLGRTGDGLPATPRGGQKKISRRAIPGGGHRRPSRATPQAPHRWELTEKKIRTGTTEQQDFWLFQVSFSRRWYGLAGVFFVALCFFSRPPLVVAVVRFCVT